MAKDPQSIAQLWAQRLGSAQQAISDGIDAVTVAPSAQAVKQQQKYINGVTANVNKWATNLGKVTLQDWQTAMKQKGLPRIGQGATAAVPKFAAFMGKMLPYQQAGLAQLQAMPKLTIADSANRAVFWINYMNKFKG